LDVYYQFVDFNKSNGDFFYHANLYANIGGVGYVVDPTWDLVMRKDDYISYISSIYGVTPNNVESGMRTENTPFNR